MEHGRLALAAVSVVGALAASGCDAGGGSRFDAYVQREQQQVLDGLAGGVPLLHRAGYDASAAEVVDFVEGPLASYELGRTFSTRVLRESGGAGRARVRMVVVSLERFEQWDGTVEWGRACATVEVNTAAHTVEHAPRSCPAGAPATYDGDPPRLGVAEMDAALTPVVLAVTEAERSGNVAELRYALHHADGPGVVFGG